MITNFFATQIAVRVVEFKNVWMKHNNIYVL